MRDLQTIKRTNRQAATENNTVRANLAGNKGGIQGHSQGPVFPIGEYFRGKTYVSSAPWASGCELESTTHDQQRRNSYRLLRLSELALEATESLNSTGGFTVCYKSAEYSADSGYMVGMEGNEKIISPESPYSNIYRYLFDHRGQLHAGFCVGGWMHDGKLYLDVSLWIADYADAVSHGKENGQIAIWDCAANEEITL